MAASSKLQILRHHCLNATVTMMLLPTEILSEIITIIFMDYLENVMPNPICTIRTLNLEFRAPLPENMTLEQIKAVTAEGFKEESFSILGPYDHNHFLPLLQTSYQVREVALSVLSDVLCIPRSDDR